jgi:hypothetical protein
MAIPRTREEMAEDRGYQRGRCMCGKRTWSDTGSFDCGCGASIEFEGEPFESESELLARYELELEFATGQRREINF